MNLRLLCLALLLPAACHASEPEKYALLVGVTKYSHARMNEATLKYPEADAQAVGELLKGSGYEVEVLLGPSATQKAVREALERAGKKGNAEGVVLVGLFGHGVQYGEDAYFGTFDTSVRAVSDSQGNQVRDGKGNLKLEPDPATMLDMKSILDSLSLSGAGNKVLLADCCREDPSAARGRAFGSKLRLADLPPGTAALFACSERERAFEHDDWGHGAFTQALLEHAQRLAKEGDATANDLSTAVFRSVREMVREKTDGREAQTVNPIMNGIVELKLERPVAGPAPAIPKRAPVVMKGNMKAETKPPVAPLQSRSMQPTFVNSVGMKMVLIPAGEFQMGSTPEQLEQVQSFDVSFKWQYAGDEHPQHRVRITKPFYFGVHEVTRGQFEKFVDATGYKTESEQDSKGCTGWNTEVNFVEHDNPKYSWRTTGFPYEDDHPVVNVSWNDAVAYAKWLSGKETGRTYRLPTEAEWEYACRAGRDGLFSFGDDPEDLVHYGNISDPSLKSAYPGWFSTRKSNETSNASDGFAFTSPVGSFRPNGFGLYDMHGNVFEWCGDVYAEAYYSRSRTDDPAGLLEGSLRVNRGGAWLSGSAFARFARSAARVSKGPSEYYWTIGFRLACVPSE